MTRLGPQAVFSKWILYGRDVEILTGTFCIVLLGQECTRKAS